MAVKLQGENQLPNLPLNFVTHGFLDPSAFSDEGGRKNQQNLLKWPCNFHTEGGAKKPPKCACVRIA